MNGLKLNQKLQLLCVLLINFLPFFIHQVIVEQFQDELRQILLKASQDLTADLGKQSFIIGIKS
jgi:hypothetical protein